MCPCWILNSINYSKRMSIDRCIIGYPFSYFPVLWGKQSLVYVCYIKVLIFQNASGWQNCSSAQCSLWTQGGCGTANWQVQCVCHRERCEFKLHSIWSSVKLGHLCSASPTLHNNSKLEKVPWVRQHAMGTYMWSGWWSISMAAMWKREQRWPNDV